MSRPDRIRHRKRALYVFGVSLVLVMLVLVEGAAQEWSLAPRLPSNRRQLELFVRERLPREAVGRPVRVLRFGHAGDLERPGVLDLPFEGRSFQVEAFDWISAGDRTVEARRLPSYSRWLELGPRGHMLLISEDRAYLGYGTIRFFGDGAYASQLLVGSISISGLGNAQIERQADLLVVEVENGRYDLTRDGDLIASVGAGRRREIVLLGRDRADPDTAPQQFTALGETLDEVLFVESPEPLVDGGQLLSIWDRLAPVITVYARSEYERRDWVGYPDIWERRIGEALRVLAAFRFDP